MRIDFCYLRSHLEFICMQMNVCLLRSHTHICLWLFEICDSICYFEVSFFSSFCLRRADYCSLFTVHCARVYERRWKLEYIVNFHWTNAHIEREPVAAVNVSSPRRHRRFVRCYTINIQTRTHTHTTLCHDHRRSYAQWTRFGLVWLGWRVAAKKSFSCLPNWQMNIWLVQCFD